jgi:hypothetical protein
VRGGIAGYACITNRTDRSFIFSFETRVEFVIETLTEFIDEQLDETIVVSGVETSIEKMQ